MKQYIDEITKEALIDKEGLYHHIAYELSHQRMQWDSIKGENYGICN